MTRQILEKSTTDFPTRWFVQEQRFPFFKLVMMESAEYYSVFAHHRFYFRRFRFRRRHFIFAYFCDARNPPPKMFVVSEKFARKRSAQILCARRLW